MKTFYFICYLLLASNLCAQDFSIETLNIMGDEELLSLFDEVENDSIKAEKVARIYLNRAKMSNDTIKMARAYDRLARIFHFKKNIQFADSIIYLTKNIENKTYPGLGYILKGVLFFKNNYYKESLDNLIIGYNFYVRNGNITNQIFANKIIINIKCIWGNPKEALQLSKEHLEFISKIDFVKNYNLSKRNSYNPDTQKQFLEFNKEYIDAITLVSEAFLINKEYDSAIVNISKGIEKSISIKDYLKYYYLISLSGESYYYKGYYQKAIDSLKKSSSFYRNIDYMMNDYYFLGLSYLENGKSKLGVKYLLKADSLFNLNKVIIPKQYKLHSELYSFYKKSDNTEKQIEYLNKMIYADSIYKNNFQYIDAKIKEYYEVPKLIKEKETLIAKLKHNNYIKSKQIKWVYIILGFCLIIIGYYVNRQQVYKKRFSTLLTNKENNNFKITERKRKEISKEIFNSILESLDIFEREQKYLSTKISLQGMAKSFGTNYNYLSRVININKGKRFSRYINDLRVEYAFKELKINSMLRNYTIKAIAKECGFKSAESFSKSFFKKYGFSPSFYLRQLAKNKF